MVLFLLATTVEENHVQNENLVSSLYDPAGS